MNHDVNEKSLMQAAVSKRQQTEAHAFIGLLKLERGDRDGAREHLRIATENGSSGSIAGDVARAALSRIEQARD
jgi:hypothetical protein